MKTLHLFIIVILFSSIFGFGAAYAEQPLLNFYNTSDRVLVGKIISLSQVPTMTGDATQYPNQTRYDVQVEAYYKDPQDSKLVTVYGYAKGIYYGQDPTYDVGDRVFLYLIKKNGFYQTQFPSFKLDNNCDARPMVPMSVLPFEGPEIAGPAGGSPFDFVDSGGSKRLTYMIGEKIHINFVATNYLPMVKYTTLNFLIKTDNNTKLVFNDTKQIMLPACDGNVPVSWDFVPENRGSYSVYANMSSSINMGGTGLLFTEPRMADGFLVKDNPSGVKIDTSPYPILSPLKQFKSGISPLNVKCSANYTLVIKKEDGSPACVKKNDTDNLMNKGWAINQFIVSEVYQNQGISVIQRDTGLLKYENGTFMQYMSIYVFINNFTKSSSSLQIQVLHDDVPYRTNVVSSTDILSDGFYKYQFVLNHAIFGSYKIIATYENRTSQTSFVIGIPP